MVLIGFSILLPFLLYGDELTAQPTTQSGLGLIVERSITALIEGRIDDFSNGRLSLAQEAVSDVVKDPLFGTGFYGFQLQSDFFDVVSSPHNQYLTAVWKMGILPGIFYLMFLYRSFRNLYILKLRHKQSKLYAGLWILMSVYILVFCMVWDVLLVPLIGSFIMFLLGGIARIYRIHSDLSKVETLNPQSISADFSSASAHLGIERLR
jgi:O-antigen ligase